MDGPTSPSTGKIKRLMEYREVDVDRENQKRLYCWMVRHLTQGLRKARPFTGARSLKGRAMKMGESRWARE